MLGIKSLFSAAVVTTIASTTALAQVTTLETEPNSVKAEANVVTGMVAGDCISGSSTGSTISVANGALTTSDYWDIATAPQATAGWYRWTLTTSVGNNLSIRGLTQSGAAGVGGTVNPGTDANAQTDSNDEIHWYSNEGVSRLIVSVTGLGTSPAMYTACLSCAPVASTAVVGTFTPGMIQVRTVGQTTDDTDFSIADSTRTIIPGYLNDDDGIMMPGLQGELTRPYAAGTYYVAICDFDQNNSEPAAIDDDFVGGEVMDYPNAYSNSTTSVGDNLTFLIDDGQGNAVVTPGSKMLVHGIEFFEFTVGVGNAFPNSCNGDGGNQLGCTDCPCTNNAPMGTIGGCLNSSMGSSRLLPSGDTSVSLPSGITTDLRFGMSGGPATAFCILNSGDAVAPQGMANPCFGLNSGAQSVNFDGLRCAVQNTLRHGGRSADGNGDVGVTNNPWGGEGGPPVGLAQAGAGFSAGQTRFFQVIHRDDPLAVCGRGLNTTQSVRVTFTP